MSNNNISQQKVGQLILGIVGILGCYWIAGIFQQKILKLPYQLTNYGRHNSSITIIWAQSLLAWLVGFVVNKFVLKKNTKLPANNMIVCAIIVILSAHTYMIAIHLTNFPTVMMLKSASLILIALIGSLLSSTSNFKFGIKKIIMSLLITSGIFLYSLGGEQAIGQKLTDFRVIILLMISVVADGFLPHIQRAIQSSCRPGSMQMFQQINKWVFILSSSYGIGTGQLQYSYQFAQRHPRFKFDLLIISILAVAGQIFVYRIIKQFSHSLVLSHIVTIRKISAVVISIVFYQHTTTFIQVMAIVIVLVSVAFQGLSEIYQYKKQEDQLNIQPEKLPDTEEKVYLQEHSPLPSKLFKKK